MSYSGLLKLIGEANLIERGSQDFVRSEHVFLKEGLEHCAHAPQITGAPNSAPATASRHFSFQLHRGGKDQENHALSF